MSSSADVLARRVGALGHLTMNRPERLNALTVPMIRIIHRALDDWADDPGVEVVLIDGAGDRGLCAGGDIRGLYNTLVGTCDGGEFMSEEYPMNAAIADYVKPVVAVMDGITMGGGIGLSGHAQVRVVTERSVIAMPETAIGLFPDVGSLYLLARAPGELGTHLALTGARLDAAGAIFAGLADRYLPTDRLPDLVAALAGGVGPLRAFDWAGLPVQVDQRVPEWINSCYVGDSVPEIVSRLRGFGDADATAAAEVISAMSPTSLKVTLAALRRARRMSLREVLDQDGQLAARFVCEPDLVEGIRAQLIDRDRNPKWNPGSLDEVADTYVETFFR